MSSPFFFAQATVAEMAAESGLNRFLAFYLILSVLGLIFFWANRNAALKRKTWPWFVIGMAVIFYLFLHQRFEHQTTVRPLFFFGLCLMSFFQIWRTRFCDSCGKTLFYNHSGFQRQRFCPQCGAELR